MRVLICGGRDYTDAAALESAMSLLPFSPSIVIEGGARGADRLGRQWAIKNGIHYATVPALWDAFGKSAGGRRNSAMLLLQPEYCIALPGGTGTKNMVKQCAGRSIPVWEPYA